MRKRWMQYTAAVLILTAAVSGCGRKETSAGPAKAAETTATAAAGKADNGKTEAGKADNGKTEAGIAAAETKPAAEAKAAAEEKNPLGIRAAAEESRTETADKDEEQAAGTTRIAMRISEKQQYLYLPESGKEAAMVQSAEVKLSGEEENKRPQLAETLDRISREKLQVSAEAMDSLLSDAEELRQSLGENARPLTEEISLTPGRMDESAISFLRTSTTDIGGAHNYWEFRAWTLDPETGEILKLQDIVKNRKSLPDLIVEAMEEEYHEELSLISDDDHPEKIIEEILEKGEETGVDTWYLTPEGLEFLFGPYVLGLGFSEQRALIRYEDHPELFRMPMPDYPLVYLRDLRMPVIQVSENGSCTACISLVEADWAKYPELYESLYQYNEDVTKRAETYLEEMKKSALNLGDSAFSEELRITAEILRLDSEVLTFRETTEMSDVDVKAAEKAENVKEYSFDVRTGKAISGAQIPQT